MDFDKLLALMVEKGGSDLFITAGVPPSMKVNGKILPVTTTPLSPDSRRSPRGQHTTPRMWNSSKVSEEQNKKCINVITVLETQIRIEGLIE